MCQQQLVVFVFSWLLQRCSNVRSQHTLPRSAWRTDPLSRLSASAVSGRTPRGDTREKECVLFYRTPSLFEIVRTTLNERPFMPAQHCALSRAPLVGVSISLCSYTAPPCCSIGERPRAPFFSIAQGDCTLPAVVSDNRTPVRPVSVFVVPANTR